VHRSAARVLGSPEKFLPSREVSRGFRVEVTEVVREFPTQVALAGVDLTLDQGEMVAIMGPSGSGKSTLLHLIGGMDTATRGSIRVDDLELTRLSPAQRAHYRRSVGFVFQRFHLLSSLGALENVLVPLIPHRPGAGEVERARQVLAEVGLADRQAALPGELSGGEQQRVAIARALIGDPGLVLADEPTGNLDSANGERILDLLVGIHGRRGTTVMIATHDSAVSARCHRVVNLVDGVVVNDTRQRAAPGGGS
jgi:putative ABC transport system ATP-binding protein